MVQVKKNFLDEVSTFSEVVQQLLINAYTTKSLEEESLLVALGEQEDNKKYDQILELCKEWEIAFVSVEEVIEHYMPKTQVKLGEVRFYHLLNAFKSPIGWITIFSGILVSLLSAKGVSLLSNQPEITVTLIAGTIIGVVFLRGIAAGPVIASGITFCILKIMSLFFK